MYRTKYRGEKMPDAINVSRVKNYTQIPNDLLRNPSISGKAKSLLSLLLSNEKGWCSHMTQLTSYMKESRDAISSGLRELEDHGYLLRLQYRCKKRKVIRGSMWAYTDDAGYFDLDSQIQYLESVGLEFVNYEKAITGFSGSGRAGTGRAGTGKPALKKTNNKKTNNKKTNPLSEDGEKITPIMFDKFWEVYPKKTDKGKTLTSWNKLCHKPIKDRPSWKEIKIAILRQMKSQRWKDPRFIPHASTWINQNRWLDDPKEMKSYSKTNTKNTRGFNPSDQPEVKDKYQILEL